MFDRKLLHRLLDLVLDLEALGNAVAFDPCAPYGLVRYKTGEWVIGEDFDYTKEIYNNRDLEDAIQYFEHLLDEKTPGDGHLQRSAT